MITARSNAVGLQTSMKVIRCMRSFSASSISVLIQPRSSSIRRSQDLEFANIREASRTAYRVGSHYTWPEVGRETTKVLATATIGSAAAVKMCRSIVIKGMEALMVDFTLASKKAGVMLIVDGTNIDDLSDYRPGIRALRENGVRSPMVELA